MLIHEKNFIFTVDLQISLSKYHDLEFSYLYTKTKKFLGFSQVDSTTVLEPNFLFESGFTELIIFKRNSFCCAGLVYAARNYCLSPTTRRIKPSSLSNLIHEHKVNYSLAKYFVLRIS